MPNSPELHSNVGLPGQELAAGEAEAGAISAQSPSSLSTGPVVLVADDDAMLRRLYRRLLGERFDLVMASNGHEALSLARKHSPRLAIMDVQMPGFTGIEVAERFQQWKNPPKVILISGTFVSSSPSVTPERPRGVLACLPKTVDGLSLLLLVEATLAEIDKESGAL